MDAQLKRGFLETCVLATLERRESYGYQIVKDVPASLGLTESTLYPLLKRLESAGCISVRSAEHNGRLRKYYHITPTGTERIEEFLAEKSDVLSIYRFIEGAHDAAKPETTVDQGESHDESGILEASGKPAVMLAGEPASGIGGVL